MLVKCNICLGNKTFRGMGYIEKECKKCDGTGYMTFEDAINKAGDDAPIKRKRRTKEEMEAQRTDVN